MTSVGKRPELHEIIAILDAISNIEADSDALRPDRPSFRVTLTFDRSKLKSVEGWGDAAPKPSWLMEEILVHLRQWYQQQMWERSWVAQESQCSLSIDTTILFIGERLQKANDLKAKGPSIAADYHAKAYAHVIKRLQELKERRAQGGVRDDWSERRNKARDQWARDETEAPQREAEPQEARAQQNGYKEESSYGWSSSTFESFFGFNPRGHQRYKSRTTEEGVKPWHVVLQVARDATEPEVRSAYRRLASKYHPDRYKGADRDTRMAEINAARDERLK